MMTIVQLQGHAYGRTKSAELVRSAMYCATI